MLEHLVLYPSVVFVAVLGLSHSVLWSVAAVAEIEGVRRQSRSETSRRAAETRKARKRAVDQI